MQNPRDFDRHGGPPEKKEAPSQSDFIGQPVKHQPEIAAICLAVLVEISLFGAEPTDQLNKVPEFDDPVLVQVHRIVKWLEESWGRGPSILVR